MKIAKHLFEIGESKIDLQCPIYKELEILSCLNLDMLVLVVLVWYVLAYLPLVVGHETNFMTTIVIEPHF